MSETPEDLQRIARTAVQALTEIQDINWGLKGKIKKIENLHEQAISNSDSDLDTFLLALKSILDGELDSSIVNIEPTSES